MTRCRMRIPGIRRSNAPDRCGFSAGRFAEAVRDGDMAVAWDLLSKESRGVRQGVWATEKGVDLQVVYRAAMDPNHPMFQPMLRDFREAVLKYWPLEDLSDLGVAPTSYVDDCHAFAFLPMGMDNDQEIIARPAVKSGLIIPMLLEDGRWKVNLPGWRLAWK